MSNPLRGSPRRDRRQRRQISEYRIQNSDKTNEEPVLTPRRDYLTSALCILMSDVFALLLRPRPLVSLHQLRVARRNPRPPLRHKRLYFTDLARRPRNPLDALRRDDVIIFDPHAYVRVALDGGTDLRDERAVLRRVGDDRQQLRADVDARLDREGAADADPAALIVGLLRIVHVEADAVSQPVHVVHRP